MFVVIVLVLLGILLVRNVRIVPQAYCYVIERLGVYHTTWNAGLHLKIPFIDRMGRLKEIYHFVQQRKKQCKIEFYTRCA